MYHVTTLLLALSLVLTDKKPKLIYVGDPMCSWCYGISEELASTLQTLEGRVEVELVVGGLRAGGGDAWTTEFRSFLRHHWEDVAKASGQPFGYSLLDSPAFDYDTEPSCRAVVAVQAMNIDKQIVFFKKVQQKFYLSGQDPKDVLFYQSICEEMDLDYDLFVEQYQSASVKAATQGQFQRSRSLGVSSFPTILLEVDGQRHVIAQGYATSEQMLASISKHLK